MSNQQFSIPIGHPDEAAMETIGIEWVSDGVNTQYFEVGLEEHLTGKEQSAGQNFVHLKGPIECHADAAAADIDGSLDKRCLPSVALRLKTDG
jgi:hypothetical protein